jgi:puromycin-sensitive aminopeptidase
MLELYLGEENYRDGIRLYLAKHSYANTVTTDLWDALEEVSGQPVRDLMNTFILQGGHPLVSLENGKISQQPFAYGPSLAESAIGTSWLTPVFTRSLKGAAFSRHLLGDEAIEVSDDAPVVLNAGGSGVFRSRYGTAELAAIAEHLDEFDELERVTLLADSWAALLAGHSTWAEFLAVAQGLGDQNEPSTWTSVATAVGYVNRALEDDRREAFAQVVRELFSPQFNRLGWRTEVDESEITPQMRSIVIGVLGTTGRNESIRAEAVRLFEANTMDGDLARSILRIVADQNRPGDYETFLKRRESAGTPQEVQRYLWGLADFGEPRIALDAAEKCFSTFRTQDGAIVLGQLSANRVTGPKVWQYLTSRWDEAMEKFPPSSLSRLAFGVPTYITDEAFANTVEKFHHEHSLGGEQRMIDQQLERMRIGLRFAEAVRAQI